MPPKTDEGRNKWISVWWGGYSTDEKVQKSIVITPQMDLHAQ
jgi:hypothetical protein